MPSSRNWQPKESSKRCMLACMGLPSFWFPLVPHICVMNWGMWILCLPSMVYVVQVDALSFHEQSVFTLRQKKALVRAFEKAVKNLSKKPAPAQCAYCTSPTSHAPELEFSSFLMRMLSSFCVTLLFMPWWLWCACAVFWTSMRAGARMVVGILFFFWKIYTW